jgi:hypothetical protein
MLTINTRYIRRSPEGEETISIARNEAELAYHQDLQNEGYTYTEVAISTAPDSTCISCEG